MAIEFGSRKETFENFKVYETTLAGRPFKVEMGKMCGLSNASALIRYGETCVLCNVVMSPKPREGVDFFPLNVEYEEKLYAAGRIPGSFMRREGRPGERAILTSRVVDRPMRPLFPKEMRNDVCITMTVMSLDPDCSPEIAGMIGASLVTAVSEIPWNGPIGGVQVGLVDGEIVLNPTQEQRKVSDLALTVAATMDKIVMIEAGANEVDEDTMLNAIKAAHAEIKKIITFINGIVAERGKPKIDFQVVGLDMDVFHAIQNKYLDDFKAAMDTDDKNVRDAALLPIMDKIAELVKAGKIKEISDMRDETDLNGLKLTLDLKRGVDPEKLMAKLYKTTPLEDSFSCNFNVLVSGQPRVMGVREILQEWTAFRMECVRRRTYYDLHGKEKRLHLLKGLAAILLDIDKAIHIIRTTEEETEVVPNLMIGFGIDEVQADYVAEIKLRHLNREYILKRTGEIEQLEKDIADLNDILAKPARIRRIIINELNDVAKKYAQPRRSEILYDLPEEESGAEEESIPDYPVTVFFTREGYLKKIPPQSLRTAGAHKLKEGDEIIHQVETRNNVEALFFTDKQQVYKVRLNELEDGKVAQMGIYLPGRLGMDEGENILAMVITGDYSGYVLFFFAGGKCAKIPLASYATKQNRRKLLKAYSDKEPLAKLLFLPEDTELAIRTSAGRMLLVGTAQIAAKTTRDSQGVAVVTLKKNQTIASVVPAETLELANPHRYRVRSLPATGALIRAEDEGEQLTML